MIIDFHTHIWPEKIAARAVESLVKGSGGIYPPVSDGTLAGLLNNMNTWKIDYSVLQPVVTKESQVESTNLWVAEIQNQYKNQIVSFGGIWPHSENYKAQIDFVASLGLKGIKFHPEYQNFLVDEDRFLKIYDYALSKGLILIFHAGFDPAYPPPYKTSPAQFAKIADSMQGGVIVAAHLGGSQQWDLVEKDLCGKNIYLDTAMGFDFYSEEQFLRILKNHGQEKILFGTDSPWSSGKTELEKLYALDLPEETKNQIAGLNAKRILGL